ncbi:MAG: nitrous oxide-stimulated promoter family protein [Verrucomicrobiota bacterium]
MNLEARTVAIMVQIFCRAHHGAGKDLCGDCAALLAYAKARIAQCPFGSDKPACSKCTVHCYDSEMRERIQTVMRYAGPRMLWRHPILAIRHLIQLKRNTG